MTGKPKPMKPEELGVTPETFAPFATARLSSLRRTLAGAVEKVNNDDVTKAMRRDPASSAHVQARVDEIIERSLTSEREEHVRELVSECAAKDSRIDELQRTLSTLSSDLRSSRESETERERALERQQRELAVTAAKLREALELAKSLPKDSSDVRAILSEMRELLVAPRDTTDGGECAKAQLEEAARVRDELTANLEEATDIINQLNEQLIGERVARENAAVMVAQLRSGVADMKRSVGRELATIGRVISETRAEVRSVMTESDASHERELLDMNSRLGEVAKSRDDAVLRATSLQSEAEESRRRADDEKRSRAASERAKLDAERLLASERATTARLTEEIEETRERTIAESREAQAATMETEETLRRLREELKVAREEAAAARMRESEALKRLEREAAETAKRTGELEASMAEERRAAERDATDREHEIASLGEALRKCQSVVAERDAAVKAKMRAEQSTRDALEEIASAVPDLPASVRSALSPPAGAGAAKVLGQHINRTLRDSAKATEALSKCESEMRSLRMRIDSLERESASLRQSERDAREKLQRYRDVALKMEEQNRTIDSLHRELHDTQEKISLEGILRASGVDADTGSKLASHRHHRHTRR